MAGMVPIPAEDLPRMVGKAIHLRWAKNGCVWILAGIEGPNILLLTPKTRRASRAKAADACYTRKWEPAPVSAKS